MTIVVTAVGDLLRSSRALCGIGAAVEDAEANEGETCQRISNVKVG